MEGDGMQGGTVGDEVLAPFSHLIILVILVGLAEWGLGEGVTGVLPPLIPYLHTQARWSQEDDKTDPMVISP